MGNTVSIPTDRGGWINYCLFDRAGFDKNESGEWEVTMRCHPDLKQLFFDLKESGYQKYKLENTLKLKYKASKLLYYLLKDNLWKGSWVVDLEELRERLGATQNYMKVFKDFNKFVLKRAEAEINNNTDLKFRYEKVMSGRTTKAIKFIIEENVVTTADIPATAVTVDDEQIEGQLGFDFSSRNQENPRESFVADAPPGTHQRVIGVMEMYAECCRFEFSWHEMEVICNAIPHDVQFRENKFHIDDPQLSKCDYLEEKFAVLNAKKDVSDRYKYFVSIVKNDWIT